MTLYFKREDLPTIPTLPGLLLMRCVSGSQAYGMATPESDVDIRGIFVPTLDYMLGFMKRVEQIELNKPKAGTKEAASPQPSPVLWTERDDPEAPVDTVRFRDNIEGFNRKKATKAIKSNEEPAETVIYAIQKYMALACNANPNILELLFTPEDCLLETHPLFSLLTSNRKLFLSKKVRWTYCGYAAAQIHRIDVHRRWLLNPSKEAPVRSNYGLPEGEKLISREQLGAFFVALAHILRDIADTLVDMKGLYRTVVEIVSSEAFPGWEGVVQSHGIPDAAMPYVQKLTGASDNFIAALQREQAYYRAVDEWKKYQNWKKTRNPKRAELEAKWGFDLKYASHAIRLVRQGEEIMRTGELQVRLPDAVQIRAIRDGVWLDGTPITYEKVVGFVKQKEEEMQALYTCAECPLPKDPDRKTLDELCIELVCKANEVPWKVAY